MHKGSIKLPAIRGIQAKTEYYISMVPIAYLPKLFVFSDEDLPANIRAQRILNKARIPEMKNYILNNPTAYVFSALTASIDGEIKFIPIEGQSEYKLLGEIEFDLGTRILINDGQHRKAAIEAAIKENPSLKYEDIAVVFFADCGLKRSQQIFSDLNRYAVRPTRSLNILYDQRDEFSIMVRKIIDTMPMFGDWVDREQATISNRAKALFTLSGIYASSQILLKGVRDMTEEKQEKLLRAFWQCLFDSMSDWQDVVYKRKKASVLRQESICAHAIMHKAAAMVGNELLQKEQPIESLSCISKIDWSKENVHWEGHVLVNNRISASTGSAQYISDTIREAM